MRDIKDSGIIPYVGLGPALQEMTTQQVRVDNQECIPWELKFGYIS